MSTATIRVFAISLCTSIAGASAQDPPERPTGEQEVEEIAIPTDQGPGPVQEISLEDAIRFGLRYNTTLKTAELLPQQARQNLTIAESIFEPELFAELGYADSTTPRFNTFQPSIDRERIDGTFGWRQRMVTGALLTAAFTPSRLEQTTTTPGFPETQYATEISVSLSQPLLRGGWSNYGLRDVDVARADLAASRQDYQRVVQDTILAVVQAYWELVFARENYRVVAEALAVAVQQLSNTLARIRVQELAERDRDSDDAEVARQRELLIVALNDIGNREDILRRLLFDDQAGGIWYRRLLPTSPAQIFPEEEEQLDWRPLALVARDSRPDLRVLRTDMSVAEVQLMATSSELMPQLDLVSSYSTEGVDQTFRSGLSGTTGLDFPDWSVRLEFSIPIGNSAAIANHGRASLELERTKRVLYGAELDVDREVREVVRELHSLAESIRATEVSVSTAELTLLTEQLKLGVGSSTPFEVQTRNQELRQARSRLLRNQLDYRIAQTRLLHVQGILQGPDGTEPEGGR